MKTDAKPEVILSMGSIKMNKKAFQKERMFILAFAVVFSLIFISYLSLISADTLGEDVDLNLTINDTNNSINQSGNNSIMKVAYVVKNKGFADKGFVNELNEMGFDKEVILDKNIPSKDFSNYDIILIGKGKLKNARYIPNNKPIIFTSCYNGNYFGFTDRDGISKKSSNSNLKISEASDIFDAYTQSSSNPGSAGISYCYLSKNNKKDNVIGIASVYTGRKSKGDVVAYYDGNVRKCFFGITESKYWSEDSKRLFRDCVNFVKEEKIDDINIIENYANSINGIRIKNEETGKYLLNEISQLMCGKKYKIDYKTVNDGTSIEDINFNGVLGNFSWNSTKTGLKPGKDTTAGSKTITISREIGAGLMNLEITATIINEGVIDSNPGNNFRSRKVEIVC